MKGIWTEKTKERLYVACIVLLCALTATFEFVKIEFCVDGVANRLLQGCLPLAFGSVAVALLLRRGESGLFGKPTKLWAMLPCLVVAIDNFPFIAYFSGKMELVHTQGYHFLLFALYCVFVGVFEEMIFRGIVFPLLAGWLPKNKKGFIGAYVLSSVVFGLAHIFNGDLLQVGYCILTGGLFGYALIKTKNVLFCAITHAIYNFCGLLFTSTVGLGNGSVIDLPTGIMMAVIAVIVGVFVLYQVFTYSEEERVDLYQRLGFGVKPTETR